MGGMICKQSNGKYAVYSSLKDALAILLYESLGK
jgi:hypothetical protein